MQTRSSSQAKSLRLVLPLAVGLMVLTMLGCDSRPKRAEISGQVLVDGEPLPMGIVQFIPSNSRPSMGKIDENGRFTMVCYGEDDGAILGTHKVLIMGMEVLSPSKIKWYAPKKYSNPNTSDLSITVEGSRDDVLFELSWDGGKPYIETSGRGAEEMGDDV